jgi:hypothetical protein
MNALVIFEQGSVPKEDTSLGSKLKCMIAVWGEMGTTDVAEHLETLVDEG